MVAYYYDWRGDLSSDGEGGLVQLCAACALAHGDGVSLAQRGDPESECEECDAANDPARKAHLDELFAGKGGR